jgi:hypothetical protein
VDKQEKDWVRVSTDNRQIDLLRLVAHIQQKNWVDVAADKHLIDPLAAVDK